VEDKDTTTTSENEDVEAHSPGDLRNLQPGGLLQPGDLQAQDDEPDFEGHAPVDLRPGNLSPSDL
jgi:hypothetical protein